MAAENMASGKREMASAENISDKPARPSGGGIEEEGGNGWHSGGILAKINGIGGGEIISRRKSGIETKIMKRHQRNAAARQRRLSMRRQQRAARKRRGGISIGGSNGGECALAFGAGNGKLSSGGVAAIAISGMRGRASEKHRRKAPAASEVISARGARPPSSA
jgi:hypothetical protein